MHLCIRLIIPIDLVGTILFRYARYYTSSVRSRNFKRETVTKSVVVRILIGDKQSRDRETKRIESNRTEVELSPEGTRRFHPSFLFSASSRIVKRDSGTHEISSSLSSQLMKKLRSREIFSLDPRNANYHGERVRYESLPRGKKGGGENKVEEKGRKVGREGGVIGSPKHPRRPMRFFP